MKYFLQSEEDSNRKIELKEGENFIGTKFSGREFLKRSQEIAEHHATISVFEEDDIVLQTMQYDFPTFFINVDGTMKKLIPKKQYPLQFEQNFIIGKLKFMLGKEKLGSKQEVEEIKPAIELVKEEEKKEPIRAKKKKKEKEKKPKKEKSSVNKFLESQPKSQISQEKLPTPEKPPIKESPEREEELPVPKSKAKASKKSRGSKSKAKPILIEASKRKRSEIPLTPTTSRSRLKIAFSGVPIDNLEAKALSRIGVQIVNNKFLGFSYLVMKHLFRSVKFLVAVNRGAEILKLEWVFDSLDAKMPLSTEFYKLRDANFEETYEFNLEIALKKAREGKEGFLFERKFWFSPTIKPSYDDIYSIVESAGGEVISEDIYSVDPESVLILANSKDSASDSERDEMNILFEMKFKIYEIELLLNGCLHQSLNLNKFHYIRNQN